MKIKNSPLIILLVIFAIALFLRTFMLGAIPFGLHEDEMMNGYVGRYILQNGRDLYNNKWPILYFDNFGDYPNVIPMYLSGLFTYIFGVTAFAVRFPIALFGALTVFPVYAIAAQVFKKKYLALCAAFFLAIMPWHVVLSRSTAENITATCVFLTGVYFFLRFFRTRQIHEIALSIGIFASTYLLYPSYRVIVPLTLLFSIGLFIRSKKTSLHILAIALCFFVLTFGIGRTVWGQGRFKQTSIFSFNNTLSGHLSNLSYDEGNDHVLRARIFHNKVIGAAHEFIRQYISYFSPNYLFTDGGKPYRYRVDDQGLLYLSFLGIVVLGVGIDIFGNQKQKENHSLFRPDGKNLFFFLILLLGLSILPSALTLDDVPNVHRTVAMGVFLIFPIVYCVGKIEKLGMIGKLCLLGISSFLMVEVVYFWHQFGVHGPATQTVARVDDRTTLAMYVLQHKQEYDKVFLPRDAKALYFLFFDNNFSPSLAGTFHGNIMTAGFGNLVFIDDNCVTSFKDLPVTSKSLVVDRGECLLVSGYVPIKTVIRADRTPSFRIQIRPDVKTSIK